MLFLVSNGIVKFSTLAYYRRHFYVVFFVVGAIITPPDVFTQVIVALPMIAFFEVSMLFIRLVHRNKS
jgi:sec-independent protein translocase protein TatC